MAFAMNVSSKENEGGAHEGLMPDPPGIRTAPHTGWYLTGGAGTGES